MNETKLNDRQTVQCELKGKYVRAMMSGFVIDQMLKDAIVGRRHTAHAKVVVS
jgi:hypothetical protein